MAEIPLIGPILNKIIGTRNERFVKKYTQRVAAINALESKMRSLTDAEIRGAVHELRRRHDGGTASEDLLVEAFAFAREAMDRAVGIRNVFNPESGFDPSVLPQAARDLYASLKAEMDAREPAPPVGEFLGCVQPQPGWMQVDIPPEFYEAVRGVYSESRPPFRARPFDVQLIGGMVLTQGKIAEMKTGEGKTIVAPLACYLACVQRQRVHVVTVNDYLVQRDRDWTFPYFHALGLTVGAIHPQHMQSEEEKRAMYRCDVVYGTTAEFGFDYLRDNMKRSVDQQVQQRRDFAIVDEVDSILIDEARTPLIISGQAHDDQPRYELAEKLARHLVEKQRPWTQANEEVTRCMMRIKGLEGDIRQTRDKSQIPRLNDELREAKAQLPNLMLQRDRHTQYFEIKEERKQAQLTHDGVGEAQRVAGLGSLYVDENIDLPHLLEQSLRAYTVYERDRDYIVMPTPNPQTGRTEPSIVIVDANTGRPMVGRQWSDGLHQAIECKEHVPIRQETQTVATVTIQNFYKMYKRLAGMTGTADTEAQEFHDIYKLDVVAIPTNKPVVRRDFEDMVFLSAKDKWNKIVDEIKLFHDVGRPVLVGTTSVEKSESLAKMLAQKHQVRHEVLNAKQHEREASIVENAGQLGSVMIATNMAGRGTDIKLGRVSRQTLLEHWQRRGICPASVTVDSTDEQLREGVFRKIAPRELGIDRKQADAMPFAELELELLRTWAQAHTWLTEKEITRANAETLRDSLDEHGRLLLHRIRWFNTIEDMGGLHVIGTERHEARRIDNQLRGRCGRQGDRGSSRFFVSLEDDLMKLFAGETTMRVLARLGMKEGDAIEHPMLSKSVERAQRKVEERNFQIRKTVLEYDEVMEHQRQSFYGLRQRVLEGRDVRGLLFEFISETVDEAVGTYLDPEYPAQCAAEFAKARLESSIAPERLRGKSLAEMEQTILAEAEYEARQNITMTIGEYMPTEGSDVVVDFDAAGLCNWARNRFGVEISPEELREGGAVERKRVQALLERAASRAIQSADLNGLSVYLQADYGAGELAKWVKKNLDFDVPVEEIVKTRKAEADTGLSVTAMLMQRVEELYNKREVEYPVDFAMHITQLMMRQNPAEAGTHLLAWANSRYKMNWTPEIFRTSTPQKVRQELLAASAAFVEARKLDDEVAQAQACETDAELEALLKERYNVPLPESMRYLHGRERLDAIRSRIENILRSELLHFERSILLETLDTAWKDHLYSMDQLRDSINFRAFSQKDPRIEYKREGSQLFATMMESVKGKVTEYVFKARISPVPPPQPRPQPRPQPPRQGPDGGGLISSGITGPGFDV
ncbi:MAG: preprotein translocase subunit SecA [Phycisphaeraceae bacterium]|nr:preprotein translocase subunit SecA [Phycisphaeraceae bacterium]